MMAAALEKSVASEASEASEESEYFEASDAYEESVQKGRETTELLTVCNRGRSCRGIACNATNCISKLASLVLKVR